MSDEGFEQEVAPTERSQPAVAGDSVEPGVERSGTPGPTSQKLVEPAEWAIARDNKMLSAASRTMNISLDGSWGFAALHPRLYAIARYRGLGPRVSTA